MLSSVSFGQSEDPEIQNLTNQMTTLREKRDWVKSDPEENTLALQNGWYDMVEKNLSQLASKKRAIYLEQTGKRWISIEEFEIRQRRNRPLF